jgi:hypothetical protein
MLAAGPALFNLVMAYAFDRIVYLITLTAATLTGVSAVLFGRRLASTLRPSIGNAAWGLAAAAVLYVVFYAGNIAAGIVGRRVEVESVYSVVEANAATLALLGLASLFEEFYWRGAVQEVLLKGTGLPWWLSSILYASGHIASGMPVFVLAALTAGLLLGYTAHRWGVTASAVAHYAWLILMFYVAPVV